jgi:hypothetical protein
LAWGIPAITGLRDETISSAENLIIICLFYVHKK